MDLKAAINFDEYLKQATEEQRMNLINALDKTNLSDVTQNYIKGIDKGINLVVFSENYCPDCVVTLPFIIKISELNNHIKYYIFKRIGNENILNEMVGESRIPTILFFDENFNPKSFYIEFPDELKQKFRGLDEVGKKKLINEFREGKYNNLIEKEILEHIKTACC